MSIKKLILYIVIIYAIYSILNHVISIIARQNNDYEEDIVNVNYPGVDTSSLINSISHDSIGNFGLLNENLTSTCMDSVLHGKAKLLFAYGEESCMTCINAFLRLISQNFKKEQVLILTDYKNPHALKFLKHSFNVPFDFFITKNSNDTQLKSLKTPFISIITEDKTIEYILSKIR